MDRHDSDHTATGYTHRSAYGEYLHNGKREANMPEGGDPPIEDIPSLDDLCDALRWIVDWCWLNPDGSSRTVRAACIRWLSVAHVLFRTRVRKNSKQLAAGLGLNPTAVRYVCTQLRADLKIRNSSGTRIRSK